MSKNKILIDNTLLIANGFFGGENGVEIDYDTVVFVLSGTLGGGTLTPQILPPGAPEWIPADTGYTTVPLPRRIKSPVKSKFRIALTGAANPSVRCYAGYAVD